MTDHWIRHGRRIARTEWTRHRRDFGRPFVGGRSRLVVSSVLAVGLGWGAYATARELASGRSASLEWLRLAASVAFVWIAVQTLRLTSTRFERLEPDFLLTAVPARAVAAGLLGFVYARVTASIATPAIGVAIGIALGLRSPAAGLTAAVAIAGATALAVAVGVTSRLVALLVGTKLVRSRRYRDLLVLFGWVPLLAAWLLLRETSLSLAPLVAALEVQPVAWFVDLALLGAGDVAGVERRRGLGALAWLVLVVPSLAGATAVVARRLWEADPIDSPASYGSHALLASGRLDRLLGEYVSRPVRTVARVRWLGERRVPRGLLSTTYVLAFASVLLFPMFAVAGAPLSLLFALAVGLAAGIAFASDPIGVNYRGLPMLLTTIDGRSFVRGHLLAALVAGAPVVAAVILPLGLVSAAGVGATIALVLVGVAICACAASVAVAVGMDVDRSELVPVPTFFTDVQVYATIGSALFRRLGAIFAIVSLTSVPAFLGNVSPVYERAAAVGVPTSAVRIGSLFLTVLVAAAVSSVAYRIAVQRYRTYRLG